MIVRENEVRDVQNNQDIESVDGPTAIVSIDRPTGTPIKSIDE